MLRMQPHHTVTVEVPGDALAAMVGLARACDDEPHVLYEHPDGWWFGVGVEREVVVTTTGTLERTAAGERTRAHADGPVAAVRDALVDAGRAGDRVFGTANFELSLVDGPRAASLPAGTELVRLLLPAAEVRLRDGVAEIRSTRPDRAEQVAGRLRDLGPEPDVVPVAAPVDAGEHAYRDAVRDAMAAIGTGAVRKVIVSRRVAVDGDVDVPASFLHGRRANTPARSFLLHLGGLRAAGFSPETVLEADPDGWVTSRPLAGTRALGPDPQANERLRAELLADPKEIYEHAVSVQGVFAELGALCRPGTVSVREYLDVRGRGTAQHLASRVSGHLTEGRTSWDAFAELFPAVTASGLPKHAACAYVNATEADPRGLYSGAVFVSDPDGFLDAALVLRSLYQRDGRTWMQAGAGVVAASTPEREYTETCEKLRSVAENVMARVGDPPSGVDRTRIRAEVAGLLNLTPEDVDPGRSLIEQGLDSVGLMTLASMWSRPAKPIKIIDLARSPRLVDWFELVGAEPDGG